MQPHPPQLPTDGVAATSTKHWLKPTLWLVLVLLVAATVFALLQSKKQVEGSTDSSATEHRAQSSGYNNPVR